MSTLNPINPDAGQVPVPKDGREVTAALAAGPTTHRLFPYVEWRYGERGQRFSRSDSAWLAWLTQHPQSHVDEQVVWLRSVLSNRGMPSILLETHLRVLEKHLSRAIPERAARYRRLVNAASRLTACRRSLLSSTDETALVENFARSVGWSSEFVVRGTGRLLVAAAVDERDGARNAVSSLERWLCDTSSLRSSTALREHLRTELLSIVDSDSFPAAWRKATTRTIGDARKLLGCRPGAR